MNMKCHLCDAILLNKFSAQAHGWDWFTGYLPETVYFCLLHRNSKERHELFCLSQQIIDAPATLQEKEE